MAYLYVESGVPDAELTVSLNGLPLPPASVLRDGDRLRAGAVVLRYAAGSVAGHRLAEPTAAYDCGAAPDPRAELSSSIDLVAAAPVMRRLLTQVRQVAARESSVLILGESGSGKEVIAQAIRTHGPRARGPFVAINAAALPESVLESELFGHERGSFTGAAARHQGVFETASGGTLFLDEVGELAMPTQAKLLRVLESGEIRRIGGNETIRTDIRLIAATNRDLRAEIGAGRFREDLYYRLAVVELRVPPLRERPDDLEPLVDHLLRALRRPEDPVHLRMTDEALAALRRYPFPGNVRELRNCIERALHFCKDGLIRPEDLPPHVNRPAQVRTHFPTLAEVERDHVESALLVSGWNKRRAAELLDIDRKTLAKKIEVYGLKAVGVLAGSEERCSTD